MIYLASPYSHEDKLIEKTRYLLAMECCAALFVARLPVFSPIVHCHEVAQRYALPTDALFWKAYNVNMLRRSDSLSVLKIDGWNTSRGVAYEMQIAAEIKLPINFLDQTGKVVE